MRPRYLTSAVTCSIAGAVASVCFIASAEEKRGSSHVLRESDGAKDADGALAFAWRIVATVTSGSRKLNRTAGPRSFPEKGADRLNVTVPEGFVASAQKGEDFAVYRLRKLMPLGWSTRRLPLGVLANSPSSLRAPRREEEPGR